MDAAVHAHEVTLLVSGRCRACAERLPGRTALDGAPCPSCGAATARTEADRAAVAAMVSARRKVHLDAAVIVALGATFATSMLPLTATLVLAAGLLWVGARVVRPRLALLSPQHRAVSAATLRLGGGAWLAGSAAVMEVLTLLPAFGSIGKAALGAAQLGIAGAFARRYLALQARRDAGGAPVRPVERVLAAGAAVALVTLAALASVSIAWVLARIGELASGRG